MDGEYGLEGNFSINIFFMLFSHLTKRHIQKLEVKMNIINIFHRVVKILDDSLFHNIDTQ